jgi:hypothetical protein
LVQCGELTAVAVRVESRGILDLPKHALEVIAQTPQPWLLGHRILELALVVAPPFADPSQLQLVVIHGAQR